MKQRISIPIFFIIVFIARILMSADCGGPKIIKAIPIYPISGQLLSCINFNVGSYWIYQDSATGLIDSQYVTTKNFYPGSNMFGMVIRSSVAVANYEYSILQPPSDTTHSMCMISRYSTPYFPTCYLRKPFTDNSENIFANASSQISVIPDTVNNVTVYHIYLVNSVTYYNVIKVHHRHDGLQGVNPDNYYIAPHVGLIRKEIPAKNEVWDLVRYRVM